MRLHIAETFRSFQGEGHLTGKVMYFIRFAGCAVKECFLHPSRQGWCDTDWSAKTTLSIDGIDKLVKKAVPRPGSWVCITGGEPTDQAEALAYLMGRIKARGGLINIQTSGVNRVNAQWDWLTVSPKVPANKLQQIYGNELKVCYLGQEWEELRDYYNNTKFWNYYLQPLWADGDACNMQATKMAVMRLVDEGQPWELSVQTHKYIGCK